MPEAAAWQHERELWKKGYKFVAGLDEVGRGAWAGPVVSAAVVFPVNFDFPLTLFDSKLINAQKREKLAEKVHEYAQFIAVGVVDVPIINNIGIASATQKSFLLSLKNLKQNPDYFLIDAFYIKNLAKKKQRPIIHGDRICASIAAASIVAKVYRDHLLIDLDKEFPGYGFRENKGYGTEFHQQALKRLSFSPIHRLSFNLSKYLTVSRAAI